MLHATYNCHVEAFYATAADNAETLAAGGEPVAHIEGYYDELWGNEN